MLRRHNSVVNSYRICLTPRPILTSLLPDEREIRSMVPLKSRLGVVAFGLAVAVSGCAALDSRPAPEIVKERAQARWDALVKGDFKTAYGYLSPGTRSTMPYENYILSTRKGFWKAVKVDGVECGKPDVCRVSMSMDYVYNGTPIRTPTAETWIRDESGNWWFGK